MDDHLLKDKKRKREHSLFASIAILVALVSIAALVLLYGRIEPPPIFSTPDTHSDPAETLSAEQQELLRQKYIAEMKRYESETRTKIDALNLQQWSAESFIELQELEEEAIEAFGMSQFDVALNYLHSLVAKVSDLQIVQQEKFQSALDTARRALADEHAEQASFVIDDALRYKPEDQEAQLLKERISSMNVVLELIKQANVARVENNLAKEIDLLAKAIQHDPHRAELVERYKELTTVHRQQAFDALLQQAHQALDNKDIKQAQAKLAQLKQIDPKHPSLASLSNKLKQMRRELEYQGLVAKAAGAEQNDDWQTAERYYQQAQLMFPDRKDLEDRLHRSLQINQYTQIIEQTLARPERLADSQIAAAMEQVVIESMQQAQYSIKLQQLVEQLQSALSKMSQPVAVTVYSDKRTYVSVLGVGNIGKVSEYKLKEGLKPGRYLFKGERRGFKDKLIEVHIKPAQPVVVRVVCDEAI